MSGICGHVGPATPGTVQAMLDAIAYRGDRTDVQETGAAGLGYRWWGDRPGKSPGLHRDGPHLAAVCGTFAPCVVAPAAALPGLLNAANGLARLDGAFAGAVWDAASGTLQLIRDPFGVRSLYYVTHAGTLYFASELKQLLAVAALPVEVDYAALHKYLTFSFVPGEDVPVKGVKRLLPGHVLTWRDGTLTLAPYFQIREDLDPALNEERDARRMIRQRLEAAVTSRLNGEAEVGLFLSGGLDSATIAFWLREAGVKVQALSLDFGAASVEKAQAQAVATHLGIPLAFVPLTGKELADPLYDLVWKLDLPFGDAVTGPQYMMAQAARQAGLQAVFNGEGGDQLFGGWTNKPMIAATLYGPLAGAETAEEQYLRTYHRFYGLEEELYAPGFAEAVGGPGQRRAMLAPYLGDEEAGGFLNRIRLADLALKGSQNILPRAERMANAWGLDVRVPLFDRALAEAAFALPPTLKLKGACEKYVLKAIMAKRLPEDVVWRRKYGMSVPITDWVLGPLSGVMDDLIGPAALARRGWFNDAYVAGLRAGQAGPHETRRRRVGERLWALMMLEAWVRVFIDGRGRQP